jgi:hypothetical protein
VIGFFLQRQGIPLTITPRVDFLSLHQYRASHVSNIPSGTFHYRVKHPNPESRIEEPEMMRCILRDHIYT